MTPTEAQHERYVVCIENTRNPASLERRKLYRVLPDAEAERTGMIRIVDESGEDYMFPADWFIPVDLPERVTRALARA